MLQAFILLMSPPQGGASHPSNPLVQFGPLIAILLIFYFMLYRPQKKRQKERKSLVEKMEKGDKVVTSSGIHGTISSIDETTVLVQVAESTKIRFEKAAINNVTPKNAAQS